MVEFEQVERQMCRNPRCRMRLAAPVVSAWRAFCCRGCFAQFYRQRCRVCERTIEQPRGGGVRVLCGRRKCRSAFRVNEYAFSYLPPSGAKTARETADFIDAAGAPGRGRAFGIEEALKYARGIVGPKRVIEVEIGP